MEGNASAGTENPEPKYKPMEFDGDPENDPSILSKLKSCGTVIIHVMIL